MVLSNLCSVLEFSVMLFQVFGVAALCLSRLLPPTSTRWVSWGRAGFVVAMIGLGLAGALCGRHDSEFLPCNPCASISRTAMRSSRVVDLPDALAAASLIATFSHTNLPGHRQSPPRHHKASNSISAI